MNKIKVIALAAVLAFGLSACEVKPPITCGDGQHAVNHSSYDRVYGVYTTTVKGKTKTVSGYRYQNVNHWVCER